MKFFSQFLNYIDIQKLLFFPEILAFSVWAHDFFGDTVP